MSDTFTASDGVTLVQEQRGGQLRVGRGGQCWAGIASEWVPALRELFQHERDKELGRWRWPENPRYIVYDFNNGGSFRIVDEINGDTWSYNWDVIKDDPQFTGPWEAARAYFAAHPEPRPWHDAKPGEVWEMTFTNGQNMIGLVTSDGECLIGTGQELTVIMSTVFTAGRRVWPEVTP